MSVEKRPTITSSTQMFMMTYNTRRTQNHIQTSTYENDYITKKIHIITQMYKKDLE